MEILINKMADIKCPHCNSTETQLKSIVPFSEKGKVVFNYCCITCLCSFSKVFIDQDSVIERE